MDKIKLIADYFGIDRNDLIKGGVNLDPNTTSCTFKDPANTNDNKDIKKIPILRHITSGKPLNDKENIEGYQCMPVEMLPDDNQNLFFLRSRDKSMEPTLKDNSLVLVHKQSTAQDGDIVAVLVDNDIVLKRLRKSNNQTLLVPDNDNYRPIIPDKNSKILGKVILGLHRFK